MIFRHEAWLEYAMAALAAAVFFWFGYKTALEQPRRISNRVLLAMTAAASLVFFFAYGTRDYDDTLGNTIREVASKPTFQERLIYSLLVLFLLIISLFSGLWISSNRTKK